MLKKGILMIMLIGLTACGKNDNFLTSDKADASYNQAISYYMQGDLNQAEKAFLDIIKDYPYYTPAFIMIGKTYYFKNDMKNSEKYLKESLNKNKNVTAYIWLSKIELLGNRGEKALEYLNSALSLDFSNPLTHYELGKYYRTVKKYEKAVYHLNYAISYEDIYGQMKMDLASLYVEIGAADKAKLLYQDILKAGNLPQKDAEQLKKVIDLIGTNK